MNMNEQIQRLYAALSYDDGAQFRCVKCRKTGKFYATIGIYGNGSDSEMRDSPEEATNYLYEYVAEDIRSAREKAKKEAAKFDSRLKVLNGENQ